MSSTTVKAPSWQVNYSGVNITADISGMVTSLMYTDRLTGGSGECEVVLEDRDRLWQTSWYPQQGDVMSVAIGYEGQPLLQCGEFQVDELECGGPPDQITLRCIAAWITPTLRTRRSIGYENVRLPAIAASVAGRHGFELSEAPPMNDVSFARVTQRHETDLEFLRRLARTHGYNFTVRGTQLVFYDMATLENSSPALEVARTSVSEFTFVKRSLQVYKEAQVSYQAPLAKQLLSYSTNAQEGVAGGDTLRLVMRCEDNEQTRLKAQAALHDWNRFQRVGRIATVGNPALVAGVIIQVTGFGENGGNYLIEDARHRLTRRGGYTTSIAARRVGA